MPYQQFFAEDFDQSTPDLCVANITPPTFAGIASITALTSGAFQIAWALATGAPLPIRYAVYVMAGVQNAAALFVSANRKEVKAGATGIKIFTEGDDQTYFVKGFTYSVGVRAIGANGVEETNTVILPAQAIATGDLVTELQEITTELLSARPSFGRAVTGVVKQEKITGSLEQNEISGILKQD